jgi:hypothetical protein
VPLAPQAAILLDRNLGHRDSGHTGQLMLNDWVVFADRRADSLV